MDETLFYVLGLSLVAVALITSFVGLRFENFPPKPVLVFGTAIFAALVVATAAFAWLNGEEEQEHRNELIAAGEELSPQQGLEELGEGTGEAPPGQEAPPDGPAPEEPAEPSEPAAPAVDGAVVFTDAGCGGCHTLAAANTTGTTGPALDGSLEGKDPAYIEESIVDPNAEVPEGFPPDVMPQNYESDLSPEELEALVSFLSEATGGKG